jgi:hypothetical protein
MTRIVFMMLTLAIVACQPDELALEPRKPGNIFQAMVNVGSDYKWQVYYNLQNNVEVKRILKTDWDLAFDTDPNSQIVFLNSAKLMFAAQTNKQHLEDVNDTLGLGADMRFDVSSGNKDSTAIGNWQNHNNVYVIDLGYDEMGNHQGLYKIKLLAFDENRFLMEYALLSSNQKQVVEIGKNTNYNFVHFSLKNEKVLFAEPPKTEWDIAFVQYTHLFVSENIPYLVMGVAINSHETQALKLQNIDFESLDFAKATAFQLSSHRDAIGYDWKLFNGSSFSINENTVYIIKSFEGIYYKLRFVDFYDSNGTKGVPTWEYQAL